ncbi:hypothetical protein GCM10009846_29450 [Agrococcus versicolor]|uniref:Endonuclease n=1 Tax=Agrococcus versicolor TaxID=501482 RepID=A0ABN3AYN4_9MICO
MQIAPVSDADPAVAIVRAAARASLQSLHDELVLARRAARLALDALPTTSLDWLGGASLAFVERAAILRRDLQAVRDPLVAAVAATAAELA